MTHTSFWFQFALWLGCFFHAERALAAEIRVAADSNCHVFFEGEIKQGDARKLKNYIESEKRTIEGQIGELLCLDSEGGSYIEGLALAKLIMEHQIGTMVRAGADCLSACAIAFMGGLFWDHGNLYPNRVLDIKARLGFHAPTLVVEDGRYNRNTVEASYDAAIGAIAELIGLAKTAYGGKQGVIFPLELLAEMLKRKGSDMYFVTTVGEANKLDIRLHGVTPPVSISKAMFLNVCDGMADDIWTNWIVGPFVFDREKHVKLAETENGMTFTFGAFGEGEEATHNCVLEVWLVEKRPKSLVGYFTSGNSTYSARRRLPWQYLFDRGASISTLAP